MRTDARIRYTRMVIKKSFIELLKDEPVNKITVKHVCELAEINRATFYKHYCDCFDLLDKIECDLIEELKELVDKQPNITTLEVLKKIFQQIKDNNEIYIAVTSTNGDITFPNKILQMCYEYADLPHELPEHRSYEREWLYFFSASGCSGVLSHWINTGMEQDADELAEFINVLLNKIS